MRSLNSNVMYVTPQLEGSRRTNLDFAIESCLPEVSTSHWLCNPKLLPSVYHQIITAVTSNCGLDSSLIYEVFLSSGLSQPILQHIWSITSLSHPGWFTPAELIAALAFIGLAQLDQIHGSLTEEEILHSLTWEHLRTSKSPPVPRVQLHVKRTVTKLCNSTEAPLNTARSNCLSRVTWLSQDTSSNGITPDETKLPASFGTCDDEWADFTSCKPPLDDNLCRPINPLDAIECDFNWSAREQVEKLKPPEIRDDDFGEFQTSHGKDYSCCSTQSKRISTQTKTDVIPARPNYNVSVDPLSEMSPLETVQHEWLRCVVQCADLLRESLYTLEPLSSSADKMEFNDSEDGTNFFYDLLEVYRVAHRIHSSAERLALLHTPLKVRFSEIETSMSKLIHYITNEEIKFKLLFLQAA